ncbi:MULTISPECIES: hypothetical protein [unclassified Thiomonas]|jgi:hypothetical protein|nr:MULTISPECIES: hypothetical protein [unclassified Thiomonas]
MRTRIVPVLCFGAISAALLLTACGKRTESQSIAGASGVPDYLAGANA